MGVKEERMGKSNKIASYRKYICKVVGPRGYAPPDWTSIREWVEKLEEAKMDVPNGLLNLLELYYDDDFGAKDKFITRGKLKKQYNLNTNEANRLFKNDWFQIGKQYCVYQEIVEKRFSELSSGEIGKDS